MKLKKKTKTINKRIKVIKKTVQTSLNNKYIKEIRNTKTYIL